MLEIPEAITIANQINTRLVGKEVKHVFASNENHKFAFFNGDPALYHRRLKGHKITSAQAVARYVSIHFDTLTLLIADGVNPRYSTHEYDIPKKVQLLITFTDQTYFSCTVQMYGMMYLFGEEGLDNFYYQVALEKPNPLSSQFDYAYFKVIVDEAPPSLSVKGLLATEQRIPGIGNGVIQDILLKSALHPKRKVSTLTDNHLQHLFQSMKDTLGLMVEQGGRDTEKNLFGQTGGYTTLLSSKTYKEACPLCQGVIVRKAFLGGNIYYCENCQKET